MGETSFIRSLAIANGASVSASYQIGANSAGGSPMVPLAVILPSSLAGASRLKFQVSKDDSTWYDILFGTSVLYITETVSSVVLVSSRIQHGCWGFSFIRLVTMNTSNAAFAVTAATSIEVMFGAADISSPNIDDPNASPSTPVPTVDSTHTASKDVSWATVTKKLIKATPGNVVRVVFINRNASVRYGQIHNKATAPAGADVPVISLPIPGGTTDAPGVLSIDVPETDYNSTGMGWAISTTEATFTDSATASEHSVHFWYV